MYQTNLLKEALALQSLKAEHLKSLTAPLDAYWEEAVIGYSDHFEVLSDGTRAGFYCLNNERQLVAFFLDKKSQTKGESIFTWLLTEQDISAGLVGTNDPLFLSLCLDRASATKVHTLLFEDAGKVEISGEGFGKLSFEVSVEDDFDEILRNYIGAGGSMDIDSVETGFEDLKGYIRAVMKDHHIYILRENGKLIATSECRISKTQRPFADVGMIVAPDQRRRGVGSHILNLTKELCYELDLQPICSCEADNIGSRKAIAKAGFVARHRIVEFAFVS